MIELLPADDNGADGEDEASRTRAYVASLLGLGGVTAAAAAVVVGESRKAPSSSAADFMPTHGGTDDGSGGGGGGGGPEAVGTRSYVEQLLAQMEGEEAAVCRREGGAGEGSQCRSCMGRKGIVSTPLVLRPGSSDGGGQYKECQRVTEGYGFQRCPPSCQRVQEKGGGQTIRQKNEVPLIPAAAAG